MRMNGHLQPLGSRAEAPAIGPGGAGPPLLIDGEDGAEYEARLARIITFIIRFMRSRRVTGEMEKHGQGAAAENATATQKAAAGPPPSA
jgi:hypothetical protein